MDFLQAEIPDVVRQLLTWHLVRSAFIASGLLMLSGAVVYGFVRAVKWASRGEAEDSDEVAPILVGILGGIVLIPCIYSLFEHTLTAIQIYIAPKVWLIEYAASLVK